MQQWLCYLQADVNVYLLQKGELIGSAYIIFEKGPKEEKCCRLTLDLRTPRQFIAGLCMHQYGLR